MNVSNDSNIIIISSQPAIITTQQNNAVMITDVNDASPYRLRRFWSPSG
jgi:hypothetical protein